MIGRLPPLCVAVLLSAVGSAEPTYLGLYMQGHKVGYASYASTQASFHGKPAERSDTRTVMDTGLLGTPLHIAIDSQTFTDLHHEPLAMTFTEESQGRKQKVSALYESKTVRVRVDNSGVASTKVLTRPKGLVVDDPMTILLHGNKAGGRCFVLDPSTVSFIETKVRVVGTHRDMVKGKSIEETVIDIEDPRATTRVYLTPDGGLVKAEGPLGIIMIPESREAALATPPKYSPAVDLGYSTSIKPEGKIEDPSKTTFLSLEVTGRDLSGLPSDDHQTVTRKDDAQKDDRWIINVHPPVIGKSADIATAAKQQPNWIRPDLHMPSDSRRLQTLAKSIVGSRKSVLDASMAIKEWVYDRMKPNAGIGVLRDAGEVLTSKEGVCRDYAILTGTLLRAAGIPTRLASGLVNWDGTFYYHAWNEVWDGKRWVGVDSTTADKQISACHVKLSGGDVAHTFTFAVLDKVKLRILTEREQ